MGVRVGAHALHFAGGCDHLVHGENRGVGLLRFIETLDIVLQWGNLLCSGCRELTIGEEGAVLRLAAPRELIASVLLGLHVLEASRLAEVGMLLDLNRLFRIVVNVDHF